MSLYDQIEFLEFFDTEYFIDAEAKIVKYSISINKVFLFELYISTYDQYAALTLKFNDWENFIFDVDMQNLKNIKLDKSRLGFIYLNFYKEEITEPIAIVLLQPTISLSCGAGQSC